MNKQLKQIVIAADAVKKKFKKMRCMESDHEKSLENIFKPVINPLNQISEVVNRKESVKPIPKESIKDLPNDFYVDEPSNWSTLDETMRRNRKSDNFQTPSQSVDPPVESDDEEYNGQNEDKCDKSKLKTNKRLNQ